MALSLATLLGIALAVPATAAPLAITDVTTTSATPNIHCLVHIHTTFTGGKGKTVTLGYRLWRDGDLFGTFAAKTARASGTDTASFILPRYSTDHEWQFEVAAAKGKDSRISAIGAWFTDIDPYTCPAFEA